MSAAYKLEFEICGVPKLLLNYRGHWRAIHAEKKKWRLLTLAAIQNQFKPTQPLTSAALKLTRYTSRASDFDNRVSSFKAVVDSLVEAGILANDDDGVIRQREYPWIKCANKDSKIRIEVSEL
jgi:hypothetical protein